MYDRHRAQIVRQLQQDYGNRYVQRLVKSISQQQAKVVQMKQDEQSSSEVERVADRIWELPSGQSVHADNPLAQRKAEQDLTFMKRAFGADLSGARVHTDVESDALNELVSPPALTPSEGNDSSSSLYDLLESGIEKISDKEPIQRFASHPNSKQPPKIDIVEEENGRGHTIEKHVISSRKAQIRVINEEQVPSSRWVNKADASKAINANVKKNWYPIKKWANTQGIGQYPNDLKIDNSDGKVYWEDLKERDSEIATLYLYRSKPNGGDAEVQVTVITCFPEHRQKPKDVGPRKKGNIGRTEKWKT